MQGAVLLVLVTVLAGPLAAEKLPWEAAGLTERQAAAHLLDRFAYGPRPGDIDRLLEQGLESSHRMAAKGMPFPWPWNGGTIFKVLDGIWGMSENISIKALLSWC